MNIAYEPVSICPADLPVKAMEMKSAGGRLVQACAVRRAKGYILLYTFAVADRPTTFSLDIDEDTEIASISDIFSAAFLYENEMVELFGVKIDVISVDYHGKLYRIERETPFKD